MAVAIAASGAVACSASAIRVPSVEDLERVRTTETVREAAALAPDLYARAEFERQLARHAHATSDDIDANLHAEHALAAYAHAVAVARISRAAGELADAQKTLDAATGEEPSVDAARTKLESDAEQLEKRVQAIRDRPLGTPNAKDSAEREAARWARARSLVVEARLICGAAGLIAPGQDDVVGAQRDVAAQANGIAQAPRSVPIDLAARLRIRCLEVLTRVRRTTVDAVGRTDTLLSELSAAGGWDPARDERGVIITLRDAYRGLQLSEAAAGKLNELGRIAAAHPAFAVQVVVHDASAPRVDAGDLRRGQAAVQALVAGGAVPSRVQAELAHADDPVADPGDPHQRGYNDRLDVVFVSR